MCKRPPRALFIFWLVLATACSRASLPGGDTALQTEPGAGQTTWHLTGVREADGQVLATFRVESAKPRGSLWLKVEAISLIDDATARRYSVLRGEDGQFLGSEASGDTLRIAIEGDTPVWMKFAAPPPGTRTVSIALPNVGTFDGIPIAR